MQSDAPLYNKRQSLQTHDTKSFLTSVVQKMDWTRQEQDIVMDIGCGPGYSSKNMLLPFFPKVKKMVAIDILPDMIEFAKKNHASDKIEYHVADIEKRCTIEKWIQQITKVISIFCFNFLDDQKEGFKNVYQLLKPGGEAAMLNILSTRFWDSYELYTDNPKWSKYLENVKTYVPESHFKKYGASYYRSLIEDVGFNVVICEEEKRKFTFPDDEEMRDLYYVVCGLTSYIPDELKSEFKEELFQNFMKNNARSSDGRPMVNYTTLKLLIQKPNV